jgi:Tfp pilus assembly protein PilF
LRAIAGIVLAVGLVCGPGFAADRPGNEVPMYGGLPKTPAQIAADEKYLADIDKLGFTRVQGSDKSVVLGWQYFFKHDLATAIKRFNQAWLLDPDNGDSFHGFALTVYERDHDAAVADDLFKQGLAKPRQQPGIYLDYGRFLLIVKRPGDAVPQLQKAVSFANMGPDAEALLAQALALSGDIPGACAAAKKIQDGAQATLRDSVRRLLRTKECQAAP